jgi:hypothetical protein
LVAASALLGIMALSARGQTISPATAPAAAPPAAPAAAKAPPQARVSPEWLRFREALRQAKPMPMPDLAGGTSSPTPTPSGNLRGFDVRTKKFIEMAVTPPFLAAGPHSEPQHFGALPEKTVRSLSGAIPEAPPEGISLPREGTDNVTPHDITPTPPSPLDYPYSFPFNSEMRLLMRFVVSGFPDKYYLCSASAISDYWVLSAGHCIYNHDPLNDGSGRGASYAVEIWAWAAETDVVDPVDPDNWEDYPYGVAKMTLQYTYTAWQNNSDFNWDFSFIALDRRLGDHTGWMGTQWGNQAASLNFDGYPAEAPYVPSDNPYQYKGFDTNNVIAYTCCRIEMDAFTYGGHSGGGVWYYDGTNRYIQGVNSTSNRAGYAEATLFTSQTHTDLNNLIAGSSPPTDRAQVIEYVFNNTSKGILTPEVAVGQNLGVKLNAFNAGYSPAGDTTAYIYLTTDEASVTNGTYIGYVDLGYVDTYQYTVQNQYVTVPASIEPGSYYVGWVLGAANATYGTDQTSAIITAQTVNIIALSSVSTTPSSVTGGSTTTGTVSLTGVAPSPGVDIALSSSNAAVKVPSSVHVNTGASSANFGISTTAVAATTTATITANGSGVIRSTTVTVKPPALSALAAGTSVVGGDKETATVTLNGPAPSGGAKVTLTSSKTQVTVPASVTVAAGATSATFTITTKAVTAQVTAAIKATYGGVTKTSNVNVVALALNSLSLSPTTVLGGATSTATVVLDGAVPTGTVTVDITSSSTKATVPATLAIKAGLSTITFTVKTSSVTAATQSAITVTYGGKTKTATLTIDPVEPKSISLSPSSVKGGATSTATVTINGAAGTGGAKLTLSSSKTTVATVPASVTIAAGAKTATFKITTKTVTTSTTSSIKAVSGTFSSTATLSVHP